jgi:lysophospholipase L1-like esterase
MNQTIRQVVRVSIGGRRVRIRVSNAYGDRPLAVTAAHVALRKIGASIRPDTDRPVTFGGQPSISIPAGALALSDPVDLAVPMLADLAVSLYLAGDPGPATWHWGARATSYLSAEGDFCSAANMPDARTFQTWLWLAGVDVDAPAGSAAVVAFGDSITDGDKSTPDANHRWPDVLAERLLGVHGPGKLAVVNQGLAGNRVLTNGTGVYGPSSSPNALARFDRDVLALPGVETVIILEGINDIYTATAAWGGSNGMTAQDLIGGLKQLAARARERGLRVIGCTITPTGGPNQDASAPSAGEAMRQAVNQWIRTAREFDAVLDFDEVVRDPGNPARLRPLYDSGDHTHPSDAGYKAMGEAIDLTLFKKGR